MRKKEADAVKRTVEMGEIKGAKSKADSAMEMLKEAV